MANPAITFRLRPMPPFRLDLTVWALRRRERNLIDQWDGVTYRRVLVPNGNALLVAVRQLGSEQKPYLLVTINGKGATNEMRPAIASALSRMLGLRADLHPFYSLAAKDRRLAPLVERFRGVKPPRFPTVFESLVNAIACQQLSLTVGIELLDRLATRFGIPNAGPERSEFAFPRPEDLVRITPGRLRTLGFSYAKARSILELSRRISSGQFHTEELEHMDNVAAVESLMTLRGVGRWSAEYVLLRGLGRVDIFPGDDVGARKRLAQWLGRDKPLNYDGVKSVVRRWRPYAGLVYFHLLLAGLSESGKLLQAENAQLPA